MDADHQILVGDQIPSMNSLVNRLLSAEVIETPLTVAP